MINENTVTLVAVGDVGPKRGHAEEVFDLTRSILQGADITFGQLESNLSLRGTQQLHMGLGSIGHPRVGNALADAGFDVMSFASNHSLDYSEEALIDTLDVMKKNKIEVIGAGRNICEARRPVIFERKQTRVGFLAYCSIVPKVSFLPLWISKSGCPTPLSQSDPHSEEVLNYMKWLCKDQRLDTEFIREGDEIRVVTD